jgi:uncharacterized protein YidB (DUF937 family)
MGLVDVLNGMRNGPRGQEQPSAPSGAPGGGGSAGGMSPITMGLLALLAYKALKGSGILGTGTPAQQPQTPAAPPSASSEQASGGSDWIDGLGKLLAGGSAGSILTGGLGELIKKLQQSGHGQAAQSWLGTGPNQPVGSSDLEKALGGDTLTQLAQQTGMSRDEILTELKEHLPKTVDSLTPEGRLPSEQEASRWG